MKKIQLIEIPLDPTAWTLDVIVVKEPYNSNSFSDEARKEVSKIMTKRYGANYEYYYENQWRINEVMSINSTEGSDLCGHTRILMIVNCVPDIIVHEAYHVLFHLSKASGVEMNYDSQEWGACMIQHIFKTIQEKTAK